MNEFAMAFGLMSRKCSGRQERVDFAHKGHHGRAPFWLRTSEAVLTKMTKAWYICQFKVVLPKDSCFAALTAAIIQLDFHHDIQRNTQHDIFMDYFKTGRSSYFQRSNWRSNCCSRSIWWQGQTPAMVYEPDPLVEVLEPKQPNYNCHRPRLDCKDQAGGDSGRMVGLW